MFDQAFLSWSDLITFYSFASFICSIRNMLSINNRQDIQMVSDASRSTNINLFNLDTNEFDTQVLVGILEIPEAGNELTKISAGIKVNTLVNSIGANLGIWAVTRFIYAFQ